MDIKDFKDLEKVLKICRKQGVTQFKIGDIEFKLGELPKEDNGAHLLNEQDEIPSDNPYASFPDGILTNDQLMYYSSGGTAGTAPPEVAEQ